MGVTAWCSESDCRGLKGSWTISVSPPMARGTRVVNKFIVLSGTAALGLVQVPEAWACPLQGFGLN